MLHFISRRAIYAFRTAYVKRLIHLRTPPEIIEKCYNHVIQICTLQGTIICLV